jgi:transcription-repair coupling factor (superfamily II helicase)
VGCLSEAISEAARFLRRPSGGPVAVAAALHALQAPGARILVVVPKESDAASVASDLSVLLEGRSVRWLPAWDTLPLERVAPSSATIGRRLAALDLLARADGEDGPVVVASARAAGQRLVPSAVAPEAIWLEVGARLEPSALVGYLVRQGYRREPQATAPGEFAVRGSIIDCFPPHLESPVRADFFDDELDRLTLYDPLSQVSVEDLPSVRLLPAQEVLIDAGLRARLAALGDASAALAPRIERLLEGLDREAPESLVPLVLSEDAPIPSDLLGPEDLVIVEHPHLVAAEAERLVADERATREALAPTWGLEEPLTLGGLMAPPGALARTRAARVELEEGSDGLRRLGFDYRALASAADAIGQLVRAGHRVLITAQSASRAGALRAAFASFDRFGVELGAGDPLPRAPGVYLVYPVALTTSAVIEEAKVTLVADRSLVRNVGSTQAPRRRPRPTGQVTDLEPGAYVVHETYGIARYQGIVSRSLAGIERDYLELAFADDGRLFVPFEQMDRVGPYVGHDAPELSRLGTKEWQLQVKRARRQAAEVAQELVVLYQQRLVTEGQAWGPDTVWQQEMESLFPYTLTIDQERALAEVKEDLERPVPMDRVICGDVGFGKTEVALRAAFKVIQGGGQVAVLVPTTILAQQHYETFRERFEPFGVEVAMLSRFVSRKEASRVLAGLASGRVDLVVATHALVARPVEFARLGLLVIDEEQRFGVDAKERLKALYPSVDVLTMSATPIPRTLELSLTGIRDLSLLGTPPADRQPILTHVGPDDDATVAEALRRELLRGGQVFYVHNRVRDIGAIARRVQELVPDAKVLVAHGQMPELALERVVEDFWHRRGDVLVCTTIVENGVDIPSVNTLIVDHADELGLAQLHQLRGRVGRSDQRAYAYLFYPPTRPLTELALERLRTVMENADLGAGYRIAMRDLELRGAGTFLGRRQSGNQGAVGYDLYVRLVTEAVSSMKGEEPLPPAPAVSIDLPASFALEPSYVPSEADRLDLYRRIARARCEEDLAELAAELRDRFGPLPPQAETLLAMARLKLLAAARGIEEVLTRRSPRTGRREVVLRPIVLKASEEVRLRRLPGRPRLVGRELALDLASEPIELVREVLLGLAGSRSRAS